MEIVAAVRPLARQTAVTPLQSIGSNGTSLETHGGLPRIYYLHYPESPANAAASATDAPAGATTALAPDNGALRIMHLIRRSTPTRNVRARRWRSSAACFASNARPPPRRPTNGSRPAGPNLSPSWTPS